MKRYRNEYQKMFGKFIANFRCALDYRRLDSTFSGGLSLSLCIISCIMIKRDKERNLRILCDSFSKANAIIRTIQ